MRLLFLTIALMTAVTGYGQKYKVGLIKVGSSVKNADGLIVVADGTVTSTFDGQSTTLKIASRKGYTIHVTDGTSTHKYVVSHGKGKLHGFVYDCSIRYELDQRHSKTPPTVFICSVMRD